MVIRDTKSTKIGNVRIVRTDDYSVTIEFAGIDKHTAAPIEYTVSLTKNEIHLIAIAARMVPT